MKKELKSGTEEFDAFGDIFSLYKEIGGVEETDDYWKEATEKINAYMKKHNTNLGRELGLAIMATLTEESKEQRYSRLITFLSYEAMDDKRVAHDLTTAAVKVAGKWLKEGE